MPTTPSGHRAAYHIHSDQPLRPETRQTLDRWGNVLTVNDARSLAWITSTRYNADNHVTEQAAPAVRLATGETVRPVVRFLYDAPGRQIGMRDANGRTATWAYDDFGLLLAHTDIGGAAYTYRYDVPRQLVEQANSRGQQILYGYDAAGRQIRIDDRATGKLTTYRLDARGNHLAERTLQNGELLQDDCSFLSASLGPACPA